MDRKILCLSGWGQPHDALAGLLPEATHLEYAHHQSTENALAAISEAAQSHDIIVGWSLGGQLAVRAIANRMAMPKALVLLGTPFQFAQSPRVALGMKREQFEKFRHNYERNPARTLDKAWELIIKDDSEAHNIRAHFERCDKAKTLANDWLAWLHRLDGFSCADLPFDHFPPTLLVHGDADVVVSHRQSYEFAKIMPRARLEIWQGCGHASHWHDAQRLRGLIMEHARV